MSKSIFHNPFLNQRYNLADGRWLELGDIYALSFSCCYKSKYRHQAEDFAMWCIEKAIHKGNQLGPYAHLNNIGWLFSEWIYTYYGDGKPGAKPNKMKEVQRLVEGSVSIHQFEEILVQPQSDEERTPEQIEQWEKLEDVYLPKLRGLISRNPGKTFSELLEIAKNELPSWGKSRKGKVYDLKITVRQTEAIKLAQEGQTLHEIATKLSVSTTTIRNDLVKTGNSKLIRVISPHRRKVA
ncbi:MAG: hypothetical protein KF802_02670 [Bdellovibrionaceae bacterium]|nr:hypothetical protein [Pseudobdellovibrionaceae bacterium]